MTLAETFLLLLLVVWYGYSKNQEPFAEVKERKARLEKENERLTKEVKRATEQIADLESRLELWHQLTGFESPPTPEGLAEWRKEACRSNPKCEDNNVLVHASVVRGQISMEWLTVSPKLSTWLSNSRRLQPVLGVSMTDWRTIKTLLVDVSEYYSSNAKANGVECRFDYRLTYASKEDYYDGRELFERYFYPAGLSRTGAAGE